MDIQISQEEIGDVTFRQRLIARLALILSYPLTKLSPSAIELILNRLSKNKKMSTIQEAIEARRAICTVSVKCRNQDGCIKRSVAVFIMLWLMGKKSSWCTGFIMDPFRSHAWIEVAGIPIGELPEVKRYQSVVKTEDDLSKKVNVDLLISQKSRDVKENIVQNVKLKDLVSLISDRRKEFILILLLGVITSFLTLAQPELVSNLIEMKSFNIFTNASLFLLVAVIVLSTLCSALQYYFLQKVGEVAIYKTRSDLIKHILKLPIFTYDRWSTGDMISRISSDTSKLRVGIIQFLVSLTTGLFMSFGAAILLIFKDAMLFLVALFTIAISLLAIISMGGAIQKASFRAQRSLGILTSLISRDLNGIRTIRSTNETQMEISKGLEQADTIKELGMKLAKIQSLMTPMSNLGLQISGLIVIGIGGYRVSHGLMTISELTSFVLLLYMAIGPISQIFTAISGISEALGALGRIKEVTSLPLEEQHDIVINKTDNLTTTDTIRFENVSFSYSDIEVGEEELDDSKFVLKDVSFTIHKNECVAIVGPSGAGKSTILQLLERFYELRKGTIYINGTNYKQFDRHYLRSKISYVEQNAPLISGTIFENLKLGNGEISEYDALSVLDTVGLHDLYKRTSKGINTVMGENGLGISGGEKQRLAMARTLLSKADIVLLDELTSNLDSISERNMKEVINNLRKEKTIIMVAHRLSTIIDADKIFVLEHGRLVGSGTHDELLENVPLYKELAKEQFLV